MATCRGIDVSVYQPAQDWSARKAQGVAFAFAKASEGEHTHDGHFATHITGIKAAGLVPGAYHFGWPTQDVTAEAANYIAAVKPYAGPGFVHWLDLERYPDGRNYTGRTGAQIREWAARWLATVHTAFPAQRVGIYTSAADIAAGHVPDGVTLWYPGYPWGAAEYSRAEAAAWPSPGGLKPLFWQFTSQPVDQSICYLSAAGLRAWAAETASKPAVDLSNLVRAFESYPHHPATGSVKTVQRALTAEGLYAHVIDGVAGPTTKAAYKAWQRKLRYSGTAADGIPGATSLKKLAAKHNFQVVS